MNLFQMKEFLETPMNMEEIPVLEDEVFAFMTPIDFYPQQIRVIREMLETPNAVIAVEQGLGKTMITMGFIHLLNLYKPTKTVITVPKNKIVDFEDAFLKNSNLVPIISTGDAKLVKRLETNFDTTNLIIVSDTAWTHSLDFNILLFNNLDNIDVTIFDEASSIEDKGYLNMCKMARSLPYKYVLNATPINQKNPKMTFNILYSLGLVAGDYNTFRNKYCYFDQKTEMYTLQDIDTILKTWGKHFIFFNREELGVEVKFNTKFIRCMLNNIQKEYFYKGNGSSELLYSPQTSGLFELSPQTTPALAELIKVVLGNVENNKVIYVKNVIAQSTIKKILLSLGVDCKIFTPNVGMEEEFNNKQGAVMIINSDRGINLGSAKDMIIYDTPPDIYQYLYRAVRDLKSKNINLFWIYYPEAEKEKMYHTFNTLKSHLNLENKSLNVLNDLYKELLETCYEYFN